MIYGVVRCGMILVWLYDIKIQMFIYYMIYGMVWYGMVWYGMVWYGMVRYGI